MAKRTSRNLTGARERRNRRRLIYCMVVFILLIVLSMNGMYGRQLSQGNAALADSEFQIHVIDVGQGDSILVVADGETMLIDAAESGAAPAITEYLQNLGIEQLDMAVATHFHADHIGGFANVLHEIPAETVLEPVCPDSLVPATRTYERYLDAVEETGAELTAVQVGDTFSLGGAAITVLAPIPGKGSKDSNNISVVLRIEYDGVTALFTGDMETPEEQTILDSGRSVRADFIKIGHHGSDTSTGEAFLAQVNPQFAAISCGADNSYGHPSQQTLDRLHAYTDDVLITAQSGNIVFLYDKDTKNCNMTAEREQE